jgi:hypothetical protein
LIELPHHLEAAAQLAPPQIAMCGKHNVCIDAVQAIKWSDRNLAIVI